MTSITLHWPSLTSRRKNEVVHQYVALSEDLLDVPDYLGDDHPALIALLDKIDPKWSYELGLVMVHDCEDGTIHVSTTGCRSYEEAVAICLLRAKGIVVNT